MTDKKMNAGLRIASMLIDHFIMTILAMLICIPALVSSIAGAFEISHYSRSAAFPPSYIYLVLAGIALYLAKDSFNGRSLAKRILGHQVINRKTGLAAGPLRCLARNLFIVLWPVEVIMVLVDPAARLGDKVAGTEVTFFNREKEQAKMRVPGMILAPILAFACLLLICSPFILISKSIPAGTDLVAADETYYNKALSDSALKHMDAVLQEYAHTDVRVYNRTASAGNMFISAIVTLKPERLELNDESYDHLVDLCRAVFSEHFASPCKVHLQFIYRNGGSRIFRGTTIQI